MFARYSGEFHKTHHPSWRQFIKPATYKTPQFISCWPETYSCALFDLTLFEIWYHLTCFTWIVYDFKFEVNWRSKCIYFQISPSSGLVQSSVTRQFQTHTIFLSNLEQHLYTLVSPCDCSDSYQQIVYRQLLGGIVIPPDHSRNIFSN